MVRAYQQAAAARAPNQPRLLLLTATAVLWMLADLAFQHQRAGGGAARIRLLLLTTTAVLWMLAVLAFQHQRPSVPSQLQSEPLGQVIISVVCLHYPSHTHHFPTASRSNTGTNTNKTNTSKMQDHSMAACSPNRLDTTGGVAAAMKWSRRWSACP